MGRVGRAERPIPIPSWGEREAKPLNNILISLIFAPYGLLSGTSVYCLFLSLFHN